MTKNNAACAMVLFLGLAFGASAGHAEDREPANESFLAGEEAAEGPEHGKINSSDASPVDPGHFEIESSYAYAAANRLWNHRGDSHSRGFTSEKSVGLSATAGVVENFDLSIASSYVWLRDKENDFDDDGTLGPETGHDIGDLDISGRYRFFQSEARALDIAYIGGFTIPMGSRSAQKEMGTSQEYWSLNQTLVASKDWGKWTANADMGYALPFGDRRGEARGTLNADLAGGYQLLPWLQPALEINYSHDFLADASDSESLATTAELVMPVNEGLRVNTGVQQSVWGRNADKATTVSVAVKVAF